MANTIKFKRGSGSDPGTSDLSVGEIAIRTDTAKLFTKNDAGSVVSVSGGIEDGDKGDITVSSSGATFTIDNDDVTYAKIQNVSATNRILGRDSSGAGDIEEITPANLRTMLNVADGATNVTNTNQLTNGAGFITATLTNEQVQDIVGGMLTGNTETGITVTYQDGDGTIDFVVGTLNQDTTGNAATATALETARTIAGVSFDGTANISLNNNAITNGAGYITSADGGNAATLDSLDSTSFLRADANDTATGEVTFDGGAGAVRIGADGDIRFANGDWTGNTSAAKIQLHSNALYISGGSSGIRFRENGTDRIFIDGSGHFVPASDSTYNIGSNSDRFANGYFDNLYGDGSNITAVNATTLDSIDSGSFLRSDAADTASGDISFSGGAGAATIAADSDIRFTNGSWTGESTKIQHHSNWLYVQGGTNGILFRHVDGSNRWQIDDSGHFRPNTDSSVDIGRNTVRVANGYFDTLYGDGSNLTGISAGATGGGSDEVFYENDQTVTTNYTITNGKNAMAAGPITINSGVTVTVGSGETLTIV